MDLFTYLMAKKGHNTGKDLFSYLLGKKASGGSGTYTTFSGTSLNISNTLQAKIKNIALEGNTSQDGTPTPDTPIPIKVVTGEQNITIQNKNLFNKDDFEYLNGYRYGNKMYIQSTESNKIVCIKCTPNTTYTVSSEGDHTTFVIWTYDNELPEMTTSRLQYNIQQVTTLEGAVQYTLTTNNDAKYLMIFFGSAFESNKDSLQVEIGDVKTEYVPYQSQTYPLSLGNIELAKIENYKDYIFKNVVGSPYYNAELDLNEWYLHKEIGKVVLDGTNNAFTTKSGQQGNSYVFDASNFIAGPQLNIVPSVLSNKFVPKSWNDRSNYLDNAIMFIYSASTNLIFRFGTSSSLTTLELANAWLINNNVTLYGILATPTNTKITDTTLVSQLENINNNARSYKDTTIIECTSESTDNEVIGFSGDIKVTSVSLGNSLNTSLLSSNIQEEPNLDDVNEIEEIEEPIEEEVS